MTRSRIFLLFRRLIPQHLGVKLALVICILVTTLISILGLVLTYSTSDILKTKVKNSHEELVTQAASEISLFMKRPVELLKITAQMIGRTHQDPWEEQTILVELSLEFPMFEEIVSVDTEGVQIASSNPGVPVRDWQGTQLFAKALTGETYASSINVEADHLPHFTVALPFYQFGKVTGVLIANVNLRGMWEISDRIRVGKTGFAFLVSHDGLVIAHPDKKLVLKNTDFSSDPVFRRLLLGSSKTIEYRAADQKIYLTSYAPVDGLLPIGIVIQLQTKEAYALLGQMQLLIWAILLISLVASTAVSFMIAKELVLPVKKLQLWSKRVALGDFEYQARPESLDELGRLFLMFKRMSKRLKVAREKEHLALLGIAATTISHRLKNAIVSLKTFAQLFPEQKQDQQFIQRFERNFISSVHHLEKIFKDLSHVSASSSSMKVAIALPMILKSIEDVYQDTFEKQKIEFSLGISKELSLVEGDPEQIRELFVNLIQNSIQALPDGGWIKCGAYRELTSSFVKIYVSDNGCGIPEKHLENIFKPFFTTRHNGMGLGLAIAKKIVKNHGGNIHVKTSESGTTFLVELSISNQNTPQYPLEAVSIA